MRADRNFVLKEHLMCDASSEAFNVAPPNVNGRTSMGHSAAVITSVPVNYLDH